MTFSMTLVPIVGSQLLDEQKNKITRSGCFLGRVLV